MKHTYRAIVDDARPGQQIALPAAESRHLARVARRRVGDEVELIAGGCLWPAAIMSLGPPMVVLVGDTPRAAPEPLPIELVVGLTEAGRLDLVVEKAAELGVPRLVVMTSERARRVPDADTFAGRRDRMARVAESAARQAGHGRVMAIDGLRSFGECLGEVPSGGVYVVDARGATRLSEIVRDAPAGDTRLIVGPEAGFSQAELDAAQSAGAQVARLGGSTLRTETAALAAVVSVAVALQRL